MNDHQDGTAIPTEKSEHAQVGYRHPPQHTQFQKGRPRNSKGRPKREKTWAELFRNELNKRIRVCENGRWVWITKRQAWMRRVANGTVKRDPNALKTFLKIERPSDEPNKRGIKFYIIGGR